MKGDIPLNALRAFESSARHLNFTRAGMELFVSQAAVSQQVRLLEERLGITLFRRLSRGLEMTDEARLLFSEISDAFHRIEKAYRQFEGGEVREALTLSCVGTFALGWLLPKIDDFRQRHPAIELSIQTNNNVVSIAGEGVDFAIRYGSGNWSASHNQLLFDAPLTLLCRPDTAKRLNRPEDITGENLLRSYRHEEWENWFAAAGIPPFRINGPVLDSSRLIIDAVLITGGVALAPEIMFEPEIKGGLLVRPFDIYSGNDGYWLTWQRARKMTPSMQIFREWIIQTIIRH
ncbi:LysR substrate-binding domain-containing protein [Pantoea sp. Sc1]|uniref:LysR substrate-binding domain-containing protein n=1 Tax=Pantoea sp. Sc1 TaxID=593105 RepID=UPI0003046FDA|nr:LysR substrate-binding domain-containing protein [Pantoea sp. Sc1]